MYALGDYYAIATLQGYALKGYEDLLKHRCFNMGELLCIVPNICGLLPVEEANLRIPLAMRFVKDFPIVHQSVRGKLSDCASHTLQEALNGSPEFATCYALSLTRNVAMDPENGTIDCQKCGEDHKEDVHSLDDAEDVYCKDCHKSICCENWTTFMEDRKLELDLEGVEAPDLPQYSKWAEFAVARAQKDEDETLAEADKVEDADSMQDIYESHPEESATVQVPFYYGSFHNHENGRIDLPDLVERHDDQADA